MRRIRSLLLGVAVLLTMSARCRAQVAWAGPPMGWNSWDSYGLTIDEAQVRANAQVMHDKLAPFGWRYVVIDEGWYFPNPEARPHPENLEYAMDRFGRFVPAQNRFPSATVAGVTPVRDGQSVVYGRLNGLAELGQWLHANGLKFGIHIIRGIPKESVRMNLPIEGSSFRAQDAADMASPCPWDPTSWGVKNNAAGQAWYDSLIRQYAAWGVDFLKVDCISDHPYRGSEIHQLHQAIERTGRPMLLSLSPGPTALVHADEVSALAQMWRISDDVWDMWDTSARWPQTVKSQFARLAAWAPYAKSGHWPDADMLPFGELRPKPDVGPGPRASRLTKDEQQTQLTLWAIARSPLILGANLTLLDDATLRLLTNRDVLRINQTATRSREVFNQEGLIVWRADIPAKDHALALFNVSDTPMLVQRPLKDFALGACAHARRRNVWTGIESRASQSVEAQLPPHGAAMFVLHGCEEAE